MSMMLPDIIIPIMELRKYRGENRNPILEQIAKALEKIAENLEYQISPRGWCYTLENMGCITKGEFDYAEKVLNECRIAGFLPVDFFASDESREFDNVFIPTAKSYSEFTNEEFNRFLNCDQRYYPDYWEGEQYYIQMIVEKVDLKTLFSPICNEYRIPIANAKGWGAISMVCEFARRFKEAEERGLKPILLYFGDFDPAGMRISDFIPDILNKYRNIRWYDGTNGYQAQNLVIDRFGLGRRNENRELDFSQITNLGLTWIDNLETGGGDNLANPKHKDHFKSYVQEWLEVVGSRKCEANAIIIRPKEAQRICRDAIEKYLGKDALQRVRNKDEAVRAKIPKEINQILRKGVRA